MVLNERLYSFTQVCVRYHIGYTQRKACQNKRSQGPSQYWWYGHAWIMRHSSCHKLSRFHVNLLSKKQYRKGDRAQVRDLTLDAWHGKRAPNVSLHSSIKVPTVQLFNEEWFPELSQTSRYLISKAVSSYFGGIYAKWYRWQKCHCKCWHGLWTSIFVVA